VTRILGVNANYSDDLFAPLNLKRPNVIDLFAGVGGLSLGACRAGFHLSLAVEMENHAMQGHQLNFPSVTHLKEDVSQLTGKVLLDKSGMRLGQLDGLIGGPPCQGFSVMGERSEEDPRNALFTKFFSLVAETGPKFFMAENVPGILESRYDSLRADAFALLPNNYVIIPPMRIKASDYGASTVRERVFFIGYLRDEVAQLCQEDFTPQNIITPPNVGEALAGLPTDISPNWLTEADSWRAITISEDAQFREADNIPYGVGNAEAVRRYKNEQVVSGCFGTRHSPEIAKRYGQLKPKQKDVISKAVRLDAKGLCPTLRAGTGPDKGSYQAVRPIHPTENRVITPREAARLQGFPDWFRFAPSKWHSFRQIGNSVSPIVAKAIFDTIRTRL
jgi:DNA (cytosine-5)-methyltransferase 1